MKIRELSNDAFIHRLISTAPQEDATVDAAVKVSQFRTSISLFLYFFILVYLYPFISIVLYFEIYTMFLHLLVLNIITSHCCCVLFRSSFPSTP